MVDDIIALMEKTILIAGKDFPDGRDLSSAAILHGENVVISCAPNNEQKSQDGTVLFEWNRGSALSARSFVLSAVNQTGLFDTAMLIFDEPHYAPKFANLSPSESSRANDELMLSYQFLTSEIISRFSQKKFSSDDSNTEKTKSKIIFIYKKNPSECDAIKNPSIRQSGLSKSLVASCAAFFKTFAENTAASLAQTEEIIPILIECSENDEFAKKDGALMSWLFEYVSQIDALKKGLTSKQKVSWIKAGAKSPGGFSIFK